MGPNGANGDDWALEGLVEMPPVVLCIATSAEH